MLSLFSPSSTRRAGSGVLGHTTDPWQYLWNVDGRIYPWDLEFRGNFVPQFLQNSASGGFTVLQFAQVLIATCRVSSRVVVRVLCANLEPVPPKNPQTGTARARKRTVSPPTLTVSFRALITTYTRPATTPTIIPFPIA